MNSSPAGRRATAATARTVAALPADTGQFQWLVLAEALTRLSAALWHCYTHPASAMASTAPNTEGWRRQETRASFALVLDAIRTPNLPDDDGTVTLSYDPVEESAHRVGRFLHDLDAPDLTAAVLADVEAEIAAVERAELGDLTGRAQQAVTLNRDDVSPVQIAAADQLFAKHTLGTDDLFLHYDPAAAVAAAHWLTAAAEAVEDLSGIPASAVVKRADDIEAIPYATPTAVLEMVIDGVDERVDAQRDPIEARDRHLFGVRVPRPMSSIEVPGISGSLRLRGHGAPPRSLAFSRAPCGGGHTVAICNYPSLAADRPTPIPGYRAARRRSQEQTSHSHPDLQVRASDKAESADNGTPAPILVDHVPTGAPSPSQPATSNRLDTKIKSLTTRPWR